MSCGHGSPCIAAGAPRGVEPGTLAIGPEWAAREVDVSAWEPGTYWVRAAAGAGRPALRAGAAAALPASARRP